MSYITRDLLTFALSRNSGESIILRRKSKTSNGDGSFDATPNDITRLARIVDLQPNEINRLQEGGITIRNGVSISVPEILSVVPDQIIRANGTVMKVVKFTVSEGASIMIADVPSLGAAS